MPGRYVPNDQDTVGGLWVKMLFFPAFGGFILGILLGLEPAPPVWRAWLLRGAVALLFAILTFFHSLALLAGVAATAAARPGRMMRSVKPANKAMPQTGHATEVCARLRRARVSRLVSWMFGL